jgi:hypothetical protein
MEKILFGFIFLNLMTTYTFDVIQVHRPIPRVIHQTWKTRDIPDRYQTFQENCQELHPDFSFRVWSDQDNALLIKTHYPEYEYVYYQLKRDIERVDFIRYVYLYHYGGVYLDLDIDCVKPIDDLMVDRTIVLGSLGPDFEHNIPNAIMMSVPGHPFWRFVISLITLNLHKQASVEATTGPILLRQATLLYSNQDIYITPPGILYGVDWRIRPTAYPECGSSHLDIESCRRHFPNVYLITYWFHSW